MIEDESGKDKGDVLLTRCSENKDRIGQIFLWSGWAGVSANSILHTSCRK